MEIKRDVYLRKLIGKKHNGLVKIITGIRRCGKSYLLFNLFKDHLLHSGVDEKHIIAVALDSYENEPLINRDNLYKYITSKIKDNDLYYVLLDEIQLVEKFEPILNSLLRKQNVDVYVTGSNSKFLSTDIITEFRGRGDEVHVYPLSFSEYAAAMQGEEEDIWTDYYTYGGLPLVATLQNKEDKADYLRSQMNQVYLNDIVNRNHLRNSEELGELVNMLASAIGSYTNPAKLSRSFKSIKQVTIAPNTLSLYLTYLQNAFLVSQAMRFDVKGKRYINTPLKYYFEDVGLRNARLGFRQLEETHLMENIVYNELRIRGFQVDVGLVEVRENTGTRKQLEVDFVANLANKRYYIQSALSVLSEQKRQQEIRPFLHVKDSFKKIVLVGDKAHTVQRDNNGIVTIGVREFLLNPHSLEL
ncbi:MAG: ATP-binding protein [Elusimicrobiaceae bacterium]|nr:ATP-binding protein [Elusimicrobiaceae bacterium]